MVFWPLVKTPWMLWMTYFISHFHKARCSWWSSCESRRKPDYVSCYINFTFFWVFLSTWMWFPEKNICPHSFFKSVCAVCMYYMKTIWGLVHKSRIQKSRMRAPLSCLVYVKLTESNSDKYTFLSFYKTPNRLRIWTHWPWKGEKVWSNYTQWATPTNGSKMYMMIKEKRIIISLQTVCLHFFLSQFHIKQKYFFLTLKMST